MVKAGVVGGLLVAVLLVLAGASAAQEFQVKYTADRSTPNRTRISGDVNNTGRTDVLDVYVTAEALDGNGKVIGRGISFVAHSITQGSSAPFEAVIPVGTAVSYRVRVTNYRQGLGAQAP
ncbi:MAG: FxLYD domain-containing protein [Candidatus Rokuibacteriota bacterium]